MKLIAIKDCRQCPHHTFLYGMRCTKMKSDEDPEGKWINDTLFKTEQFPEWCPLEDASIVDAYYLTDADGMPERKRGEL